MTSSLWARGRCSNWPCDRATRTQHVHPGASLGKFDVEVHLNKVLVEPMGIEPTTSALRTLRSPS